MEHVATTNGITIDHCNDWLRQSANLHLHVEHRQAGDTLVVNVTATSLHMHVAT